MQNGLFVDDQCKEFTFSGYNTWQVPQASAFKLFCYSLCKHYNAWHIGPKICERLYSAIYALQPIEAALNMCCGGYTALVGQFKEAGESPLCLPLHA